MYVRQAEDSHHGIPDELFGPPAQRGQLIGCGIEKPAEHLSRALRVQPLPKPRRIDEIGEQHRDHLALLGLDEGSRCGATVGAEARAVGDGETADRARPHHGSRICCSQWPTPSSKP